MEEVVQWYDVDNGAGQHSTQTRTELEKHSDAESESER